MKSFFKLLIVSCGLLVPLIVFAAPENFKSLINIFTNLIKAIIPVIGGLAILYFFWGIAKYIFSAGSEELRSEAKNVMTWGLVAMFVMFSFYGILSLFGYSFLPSFGQNSSGSNNLEIIDPYRP